MGLAGAVVYAGNNSRRKAITLRKNHQVVAYESHDDRWNRISHKVRGRADRIVYSMEPVTGGPSFEIAGIPSKQIRSAPTPAYAVGALDTALPGQSLTSEDRFDAKGQHVMQRDSSAEFQGAAQGLVRLYPGTVTFPFANVHDDEADTGNVAESLDNFMEKMRLIPSNLDFFAYCGHGAAHMLPSAGLKMGRMVKRRGEQKHWEESDTFGEFIAILRRSLKPGGNIIFYACSTGVVNGFAQGVSSKIPNAQVFGHTVAGRAKANPFKARMKAGCHETYANLLGGEWHHWQKALEHGDLWARYWNMTVEELISELSGGKRKAA